MATQEELEKERYQQYLAEEKIIQDSLTSNDVELNRTMRYFSGVILLLLSAYIDWNINYKTFFISISYAPFVFSIVISVLSFVFTQKALYKQMEFNEEYYIDNVEEARSKKCWQGKWGGWLMNFSVFLFSCGIIIVSILIILGILEVKGGDQSAK